MIWRSLCALIPLIASSATNNITIDELAPIRCPENADCGNPLFLTPMLKSGRVQEAQQAAKVTFPDTDAFRQVRHSQSYSGFFTVNETFDSNMFFWFFLAENEPDKAPILLYLEGGPGGATTTDAFFEIFLVEKNLQLKLSPNRWTLSMNVLLIDSPVGSGFSFTRNASGYATTQEDYTRNLYETLLQFFQLFPNYRSNEFFIGGESYGGKYVPALAYDIHEKNPSAPEKINLKGIILNSGVFNPLIQTTGYSQVLFDIGVIDMKTKREFASQIESHIRELIREKQFTEASRELNQYMSLAPNLVGAFHEVTGLGVNNYMGSKYDVDEMFDNAILFLKKPAALKSLHVGHLVFWNMNMNVYNDLVNDLTRSVAPQLETLMDNYRVLMFSGQLEIMTSYLLMVDAIRALKWTGAEAYRSAHRHQWWVDGELAGYAKSTGNFTEVLVRNASHGCPEQPSWVWDLMRRFVANVPLELK